MIDPSKDYYAVLGVLPTAEPVVIRAAYKAMAQRYHPDRFEGDPKEATRRMAEINEAYAVLSDSAKRKKYDDLRGSSTQSSDSYFDGEANDPPPNFDPLEKDWAVALRYYTDLKDIDARLAKISWRLAYSFRAYMLSEKQFANRMPVAAEMERSFLEIYFGTNQKLIAFARDLIYDGRKAAAKALNEAVRVLGSGIDADLVIRQIRKDFLAQKQASNDAEMAKYGVWFDGEYYRYQEYRYDRLADAIEYARLQAERRRG